MKKLRRLSLLCALSLVLLLALAACAVNPVTGEQQLMLVSEQDESKMGISTDQSVADLYGVYDDPALQGYLQQMGLAMGRLSHRPSLAWQFKVMDSPVVNAFAAPGGYVYVTRGLLAATNNEAELAGILGHEIGHVTARHSAQQYSKMMLANLGLGLGQALLGDYGDALGPMLQSGAGLLFLKFSRDDERQADALGVEYATRAGYDAARMADFFVTLQRQPGEGQQAARLPEFFSTHPNPVNREATVRAMASQWQAKVPGQALRTERAGLLKRVDGLVFGDDPRKGFREGNWYYLPQYKVKLPIPDGWGFEREGNTIQMIHPQKKAVSMFSIRPQTRMDQAIDGFLKSTGAKVQQERILTSTTIPGRLLLSLLTDGQRQAVVISHFYQKGGDAFVFHGMTSAADFEAMSAVIQKPAKGFAVLSEPEKLNRKPKRLAVITVPKAMTLEKALLAEKVDHDLWGQVAWLNGRQLADSLRAGEQIKVVR